MATGIKLALKRVILTLLIVALIMVLGRLIVALIVRLVGLSMILVQVLALPLILLVLVWFVYRLWGKPYFRAWRMNRARNARMLREASFRNTNSH
jgi:hypothetical protein